MLVIYQGGAERKGKEKTEYDKRSTDKRDIIEWG